MDPRRSTRLRIAGLLLAALLVTALALGVPGRAARSADDGTRRSSSDLVVLVHGMGRTSSSMVALAWALEAQGYRVLNWGYSSTCCTVAELGKQLAEDPRLQAGSQERVHFVGHSLGTVIIRWVLANQPPPRAGRVVMLAPPNQGSHEADRMAARFGRILKPLPELRTEATSTARTLALPRGIEVGVIAGKYDGKVSVAETHLAGEAAHVVVPATHSFLMLRSDVTELTVRFLRTGGFGQ